MIEFTCSGCGRSFNVSDDYAGRSARCKGCGATIIVPPAAVPTSQPAAAKLSGPAAPGGVSYGPTAAKPSGPAAPGGVSYGPAAAKPSGPAAPGGVSYGPAAAKPGVRFRRLTADARQIAQAFSQFPPIKIIQSQGDPPDLYRIEYHIHGLDRGPDGKPVRRDLHEVEIQLTADYPRLAPKCRMLTSIFHPNIDTSTICVGDHWTAGERLTDLIIRIGQMIAYQAYNIRSPLDGEAAMWADLHSTELPIDPANLHPPAL